MPTVKYKCGNTGKNKKRTFAYNAVGKAQADSFARMNNGSLKMNPGPKEEKKTTTKDVEIKKKAGTIDFNVEDENKDPKNNELYKADLVRQAGGMATTLIGAFAKGKK